MAQTTSKRCETILVNELLAFVQNKLDVMDELSLEQICLTSYADTDIYAAKVYLKDTAQPNHVRLITRRREGNGSKDIRDIFRVFKTEDPDDIPTYVARDLKKLPPVMFDHVDVTALLKDIVLLKADITDIKGKLEASERASDELRRELTSLRGQNVASATPPAACIMSARRSIAVQHDTASLSNSSSLATDTSKLRVGDLTPGRAQVNKPTPPPPRPEPPALRPTAVPFIPQEQKKAEKSRSFRHELKPSPPETKQRKEKAKQVATKENVASNVIVDDDGFILAETRKRRQRRNRNKRGTIPAASTTLKAAEPTAQIYVSRLQASTSPDDIKEHMRKMRQHRSQDSRVAVDIQQLDAKRATHFRSFVIRVPRSHLSEFLRADFWPEGVVFRRYRSPLKSP